MRRSLHYVFKIGDRQASYDFYTKILGMKVLRHEEFDEGCKATCNGPYDGKWSKTMIGYGDEDSHFVLELTYNYGIGSYALGNDIKGLSIASGSLLGRAKENDVKIYEENDNEKFVCDPDGHRFFIEPGEGEVLNYVHINTIELEKSVTFWSDVLDMTNISKSSTSSEFTYGDEQCRLKIHQLPEGSVLERKTGFGRIAFACPSSELKGIQEKVEKNDGKVLTPYISLDTPGKATVQVVIIADPNDHEICFVNDDGFRELSKVDPEADSLLRKAISEDKSNDWFKYKGGKPIG